MILRMCCQDSLAGKMGYRKSMKSTKERTSLVQKRKRTKPPPMTRAAFMAPGPMGAQEFKTQHPLKK